MMQMLQDGYGQCISAGFISLTPYYHIQNAAKSQMLSAPYDRLRVGNSRGSAGPDARRAGSVASFADPDAAKDSEAPARPSVSGSGSTTSFVRRQRTQFNHSSFRDLFLIISFFIELYHKQNIVGRFFHRVTNYLS